MKIDILEYLLKNYTDTMSLLNKLQAYRKKLLRLIAPTIFSIIFFIILSIPRLFLSILLILVKLPFFIIVPLCRCIAWWRAPPGYKYYASEEVKRDFADEWLYFKEHLIDEERQNALIFELNQRRPFYVSKAVDLLDDLLTILELILFNSIVFFLLTLSFIEIYTLWPASHIGDGSDFPTVGDGSDFTTVFSVILYETAKRIFEDARKFRESATVLFKTLTYYKYFFKDLNLLFSIYIKNMFFVFFTRLGPFKSSLLIYSTMFIVLTELLFCNEAMFLSMIPIADWSTFISPSLCVFFLILLSLRDLFFYSIFIMLLGLTTYVPLLLTVALFTVMERKGLAVVQRRLGPNVIGYSGIFQPIADALKLLTKEFSSTSKSNGFIYKIAPVLSMLSGFLGWLFIPFNNFGSLLVINLPIMFILAVSSIGAYGIIFAGWSSNSQFPFLGALRATAQMISYELVMGIVILCLCILSQSFTLVGIVEAQHDIWFILVQLPIFFIFLFAAVAETNRPPLDHAEAESELVSGYNTEYGALGFTIFFIAEYANVILMSAIIVILFFGGWMPPFPMFDFLAELSTPAWCCFWFASKTILVMLFFVWVRACFPRMRYDQLMAFTWKTLLPLSLSCLVAVAFGVWLIY